MPPLKVIQYIHKYIFLIIKNKFTLLINKKHNSLAVQYAELEHLKNNMNEYLGRNKAEKKESVIGAIKSQHIEYMDKHKEKKEVSKEVER